MQAYLNAPWPRELEPSEKETLIVSLLATPPLREPGDRLTPPFQTISSRHLDQPFQVFPPSPPSLSGSLFSSTLPLFLLLSTADVSLRGKYLRGFAEGLISPCPFLFPSQFVYFKRKVAKGELSSFPRSAVFSRSSQAVSQSNIGLEPRRWRSASPMDSEVRGKKGGEVGCLV